jgi:hypothetical protein
MTHVRQFYFSVDVEKKEAENDEVQNEIHDSELDLTLCSLLTT